MPPLRVLTVTNMWPTAAAPQFGIFVKRQVEEVRRMGLDVDVLFVNGRESRANYVRGFGELRRALRRRRYDVVHADYVFSGLIARAQLRCPIVLAHHGIEVLRSWQAPLCWITSRVVDAVIVRSDQMRERLGLPQAELLPYGVDLGVFQPRARSEARRLLSLPLDLKLVLFVGEARPEKRLDIAEKAVALLPDVRLRQVCGESPDTVALFLSAADVLVLPSDNEGSPNVVAEAMACNLPIVAVDVGAVRELIGGTDGCFIARRTPKDFAAKIRLVLERGERTDGRRHIEPLAWSNVTPRLIDVYERVAARRMP